MPVPPITDPRAHFAAKIAALEASTYPVPKEPYSHSTGMSLLSALGCRTYDYMGNRWTDSEQTIDADAELLSLEVFARLHSDRGIRGTAQTPYCILDGLSHNERWLACLNTPDLAYMLADLTLRFVMTATLYRTEFPYQMLSDISVILSQWLGLDTPDRPIASFEDTARSMFGNAWWELTESVAAKDEATIKMHMLTVVAKTRPDFLPGLLPGSAISMDLPIFDGYNP